MNLDARLILVLVLAVAIAFPAHTLAATAGKAVVIVDVHLPGVNSTLTEVTCDNITVIEVITSANTTMINLKITGTLDNSTEVIRLAYQCVSSRNYMDIASLVLEAAIRASQAGNPSIPEAREPQATMLVENEEAVSRNKADRPLEEASASEDVTKQATSITEEPTVVEDAGINGDTAQGGIETDATSKARETGYINAEFIAPIAAGILLGLLFYYIARLA